MPKIEFIQCGSDHMTYGRTHSIDHIVVHYTATNASARNNAVYFSRNQNQGASAHYFIDGSGIIYQSVADGDTAWHAGNWQMNCRAIGIEVVSAGQDFTGAEISELAWLVQNLMAKYGIPASRVIRHFDVTGKHCPAPYVDWSKWVTLHAQITSGAVSGGGSSTPAPAPTPAPVRATGEVRYRAYVGGQWLPEMVNHKDTGGSSDTFAGILGRDMTYLAINMNGWYQVKTVRSGWLPKVYGYNVNDFNLGCAGDGSTITAVRAYYVTPNPNSTGWQAIEYQVHPRGGSWLPCMVDLDDTGGSSDDFAGNGGAIDGFRARIINV